jgi:multidrug efflux pump subunit AcrA (membrane-fusion protein)
MTPRPAETTNDPPETLGAPPTDSLSALLAEHCARVGAEGGAVITVADDGLVGIPAIWPRPKGGDEPPAWLTAALRAAPGALRAAASVDGAAGAGVGGAATAMPLHEPGALYGEPPTRHVVLVPLPEATGGSESQDRAPQGAECVSPRETNEKSGAKSGFSGANRRQTSNSERINSGQQRGREGQNGGFAGEKRDFAGAAGGWGGPKRGLGGQANGFAGPAGAWGGPKTPRRGVLAMAMAGQEPAKLVEKVVGVCVRVPAGRLYALQLAAQEGQNEARRAADTHAPAALAPALTLTSAVNDQDRFLAAAMALCNELAARFACERVSLGLLRGRYVRLAAMSHTEKFSRRMQMVQIIEAAMEECLDQDIEVVVPAPASAQFVCRSARELSDRGTPRLAVLSLPLRREGKVLGAVCVERAGDTPFAPAEVETMRLACDLCTVRLLDLRRRDRWIGAKAASGARAGLAAVVGPRHTWAKVAAVLLIAAGVYIAVASGDYRVDAPFTFEAATRQIVPAPFEGEVDSVEAKLGDKVNAGAVLATLKTLPLRRKLDQARAGLYEHLKQADAARSDKKWADAQMAAAQARQFQEQIALLTEQIEQATIKARIDGTVIRGGLDRFVGSSVEKGQVLFEIAPLEDLRAELLIPEDQVADLQAAMRAGKVRAVLSAGAYPDRPIEAVMERVLPLAEKIDGKVVFRARAVIAGEPQSRMTGREWIRPGMEGAAHVSLGRRNLAWIWSRRIVNRLRLWLWM